MSKWDVIAARVHSRAASLQSGAKVSRAALRAESEMSSAFAVQMGARGGTRNVRKRGGAAKSREKGRWRGRGAGSRTTAVRAQLLAEAQPGVDTHDIAKSECLRVLAIQAVFASASAALQDPKLLFSRGRTLSYSLGRREGEDRLAAHEDGVRP